MYLEYDVSPNLCGSALQSDELSSVADFGHHFKVKVAHEDKDCQEAG
jgi:hypothetical protein